MAHTRDIGISNGIGGMSRKNRNVRKVNTNRLNLGVKMGQNFEKIRFSRIDRNKIGVSNYMG